MYIVCTREVNVKVALTPSLLDWKKPFFYRMFAYKYLIYRFINIHAYVDYSGDTDKYSRKPM